MWCGILIVLLVGSRVEQVPKTSYVVIMYKGA
jgi:hypothetical protein